MTLTVGTSLQQNKYEIQDILNLSDIGATYKAIHTYLNQPVILHTFNQIAQQRPDIDQLKQQFRQQIRSLVQQPQPTLRILDCFEENNLPFAVLPFQPDQPPVKLSDWFILTSAQSQVDRPGTDRSKAASLASPFSAVPFQPEALPTQRQTQATSSPSLPTIPAVQHTSPPQSIAAPSSYVPRLAAKRRVPTALMVASLLGGFVGAGMGLALRLATPPQENGKATLSLFNKEQSFPSSGNWPIRERPIFTPETAIEQPLYRTNPPTEYVDPLQVLPSESYPPYPSPLPTDGITPTAEPDPNSTLKDIPTDSPQSAPTVELPPDVDSLYTDEWLPPIDAFPPNDRAPASGTPFVPNDGSALPPQSYQTLPSSPSKRFTSNGISVVNQ